MAFPGSSWARPCILFYMDCKKASVCLCLLLVAVEHCICVLKQRGKEKFEDLSSILLNKYKTL